MSGTTMHFYKIAGVEKPQRKSTTSRTKSSTTAKWLRQTRWKTPEWNGFDAWNEQWSNTGPNGSDERIILPLHTGEYLELLVKLVCL